MGIITGRAPPSHEPTFMTSRRVRSSQVYVELRDASEMVQKGRNSKKIMSRVAIVPAGVPQRGGTLFRPAARGGERATERERERERERVRRGVGVLGVKRF